MASIVRDKYQMLQAERGATIQLRKTKWSFCAERVYRKHFFALNNFSVTTDEKH